MTDTHRYWVAVSKFVRTIDPELNSKVAKPTSLLSKAEIDARNEKIMLAVVALGVDLGIVKADLPNYNLGELIPQIKTHLLKEGLLFLVSQNRQKGPDTMSISAHVCSVSQIQEIRYPTLYVGGRVFYRVDTTWNAYTVAQTIFASRGNPDGAAGEAIPPRSMLLYPSGISTVAQALDVSMEAAWEITRLNESGNLVAHPVIEREYSAAQQKDPTSIDRSLNALSPEFPRITLVQLGETCSDFTILRSGLMRPHAMVASFSGIAVYNPGPGLPLHLEVVPDQPQNYALTRHLAAKAIGKLYNQARTRSLDTTAPQTGLLDQTRYVLNLTRMDPTFADTFVRVFESTFDAGLASIFAPIVEATANTYAPTKKQ